MKKVIIISTEHMESGKCSSNELLKIIESINPEVIFEEEPNDDQYRSYYSDQNSFKTLEIQTIIKYKQNHNIVNIPIDKPINEFVSLYLLDWLTKIFKKFNNHNILVREHCYLRNNNGFTYLNSEKCSKLNEKKLLLEKQIISKIGPANDELNKLYNQFHHEVDARETKMINKPTDENVNNIKTEKLL